MKKILEGFSQSALRLLVSGMSLLVIYFIYIFYAVWTHTTADTSVLIHLYFPLLEHVIMSLTILILGALLLDIAEKELKKK